MIKHQIIRPESPLPTWNTPLAGVDEAGRGPLAGPVGVAAVILDPNHHIDGLNDSKEQSVNAIRFLMIIIAVIASVWRKKCSGLWY